VPIVTVLFGIVGIAVGIIVIRNSNESSSNSTVISWSSTQIQELQLRELKLERQIAQLESSKQETSGVLSDLQSRVKVLEDGTKSAAASSGRISEAQKSITDLRNRINSIEKRLPMPETTSRQSRH
jgi:chromosome segregation ATPase